jgi:cell division protein FtsW (lipid II flippase)
MSKNMPATHMDERTTGPFLPAALISVLVLTLMGLINLWDFKPIQWYHTLYTGTEGEWYHIKRQLFAAVAGVVAFCVLRRHTARLSRYRWVWAVLPLILLALPLIPGVGVTYAGTWRYFFLFSFPIYSGIWGVLTALPPLAAWLSGPEIRHKKIFYTWVLAINLLLALQPDLPMMALFNSVILVMAAVSRTEKRWKTAALLAMLMTGFLAAGFLGNERSWQNIRIMYDYRQDPFGVGFETRRSIEDVRSGGLTGQGFGSYPMPVEDRPAYILPNTVSTFMLQITGRNLGLVGIGYVVLLLIILLGSGWVSATHQPDRFARMLGMGGISFLGFQALFSILRTLNLLPLMPAHAIPFFACSQQITLAAFIAMAFIFPGTPLVPDRTGSISHPTPGSLP